MKILDVITEDDIKDAVISEYQKRLLLQKLKDEQFKKKYGMSLQEFEEKNLVRDRNFGWEVEQDAMEWEHAIESIRYLQEKIALIQETDV